MLPSFVAPAPSVAMRRGLKLTKLLERVNERIGQCHPTLEMSALYQNRNVRFIGSPRGPRAGERAESIPGMVRAWLDGVCDGFGRYDGAGPRPHEPIGQRALLEEIRIHPLFDGDMRPSKLTLRPDQHTAPSESGPGSVRSRSVRFRRAWGSIVGFYSGGLTDKVSITGTIPEQPVSQWRLRWSRDCSIHCRRSPKSNIECWDPAL